jgi:hypothetical protein
VLEKVRTTLRSLGFLPNETIEQLTRVGGIARLYRMMQDLLFTLHTLNLGLQGGMALTDTESFNNLLLFELKDDLAIQIYGQSLARQLPGDAWQVQVDTLLATAFTIQNLRTGAYKASVATLHAGLTPEQKEVFPRIFRAFLEHSVIIQSLFDPISPDSFFENLVAMGHIERAPYIGTLEDQYDPAVWPVVSDVMLFTAQFI